MKTLKFGIAGIGNIGSYHAENILSGKVTGAQLTAVCDVDGEKLTAFAAKHPEIARFSDYRGMIDSGLLDAVIVAVPHYTHGEITVYALSRGLHTICEKPVAVSVTEALKINQAAKASDGLFAVMFNQRTDPLFAKARELVAGGILGQKKRLTWIVTNWYRTQAYYRSSSWRATWRGEGGGVLLNQAPHNIDLWQWIFGMPDEIYAVCDIAKYHDIEVEDDVRILARYRDGATAEFITSTGEFPGTNRLELVGDLAKLVLEDGKLKITRLNIPEREVCFTSDRGFTDIPSVNSELTPDADVNGHVAIIENFVKAVNGECSLISPGADAINELTISNAAYLSAWTGKPVGIPFDCADFDARLKKLSEKSAGPANSAAPSASDPERWKVRW